MTSTKLLAVEGIAGLTLPKCAKGLGDLIFTPDSKKLIDGVKVQPVVLWPDDRGYFLEVQRMRQGVAAHFPLETCQISAALNYPGTIKAFHLHFAQSDCWTPVMGMMQVVLADLRQDSPTFGARNTLYVGSLRPWQILIPPGVAHGYKTVSPDPSMLVYMTDLFYNPADEGRIVYNNPDINYDWETQYK